MYLFSYQIKAIVYQGWIIIALLSGAGWGDFERKYPTSIPVKKIIHTITATKKNSSTFSEPRKRKFYGTK